MTILSYAIVLIVGVFLGNGKLIQWGKAGFQLLNAKLAGK